MDILEKDLLTYCGYVYENKHHLGEYSDREYDFDDLYCAIQDFIDTENESLFGVLS